MFDWELRDPWFLVLLAAAPLVYWLATRAPAVLGYSSLALFAHTTRSWRQRWARLPAWLLVIALICLVIALARPRTPHRETRLMREGIAIMMVVDLSSSMDARDLVEEDRSVNRLDAVKDVFVDFVLGTDRTAGRGRPDDLIGMVTFARYADSLCPLTLDHGNLVNLVRDLSIVTQRQEDGTALGDGLGLAVERLRRSRARSRVAILLTDGVSNTGVIEPLKAAELARQSDIRVYCIGAGTRGMALMPYQDLFGRSGLVPQPVDLDEETLEKIAETSGGRYFRAVDKDALADIYAEIDQLERTDITELKYLQYEEFFSYFVAAALGCLAGSVLLSGTIFRRLP
jgi:Ca-activated chloride channel homolog